MGRGKKGFQVPVCDSFEAKIRNDQLCYEVNLEKYKDKKLIKQQLKAGLVLVLDYNLDRQSEQYNPSKRYSSEKNVQNFHIYLDTISK